uniref:Ig-like domain-containing protein n=1 Tax=Pelusios castaneus TaxID=367368 RepID=A0A8C8RBI7_9SAUR
ESCTVELQVPRGSQYHVKPGDSLSIKCPVKCCTEKPVVNWCKIEEESCLLLKDGLTRHTTWLEECVFLLNFVAIHPNDSGQYRCLAAVGNLLAQSHAVSITVKERVGFSLLLHYLLAGSTISFGILVTILYCTLQHRVTLLSGEVASTSVLTKTGNNLYINPRVMPDDPNEHSSGMLGVSCDDWSEEIYENAI